MGKYLILMHFYFKFFRCINSFSLVRLHLSGLILPQHCNSIVLYESVTVTFIFFSPEETQYINVNINVLNIYHYTL